MIIQNLLGENLKQEYNKDKNTMKNSCLRCFGFQLMLGIEKIVHCGSFSE